MLDDRAANVESVKAMGDELTSQADEAEKQQVEEQLAELSTRWERLTQTAAQRQQQLDLMLAAAKAYHDLHEPFSEWLDSTEKKANALDNLSSDPVKMEGQLQKQKDLKQEIGQKKMDLDDIIVKGHDLMKLCTG